MQASHAPAPVTIRQWEQKLASTAYINPLPGLSDNVTDYAILERLEAAVSDMTGPFDHNEIKGWSAPSMYQAIAANRFLRDRLLHLLQQGRFHEALKICLPGLRQHSPLNNEMVDLTLRNLQRDWVAPYLGSSSSAMKDILLQEEKRWSEASSVPRSDVYYAKTIPILQSSGTGESRLVDELSKDVFTISFTLRLEGQTGFPPGDAEITNFLRGGDGQSQLVAQSLASTLLAGALGQAHEWCIGRTEDTYESLSRSWHDVMAQVENTGLSEEQADLRSKDRRKFCRDVLEVAKALGRKLTVDPNWKRMKEDKIGKKFKNVGDFLFLNEEILEKAKLLSSHLSSLPGATSPRVSLLVFDEAGNLFETPQDKRYAALRRQLRTLHHVPLWTLFLSTQSKIESIAPPWQAHPSARIIQRTLKRLPSFSALPLDIEVSRRLSDVSIAREELYKPLCRFSTASHITSFGRPLWLVYRAEPYAIIRETAKYKLLCGTLDFSPNNKHHVFAAVSSRLSLDTCTETYEAVSMAKEAVNSHLRIVIRANIETGMMNTITPSEPIVADAVAHCLTDRDPTGYGKNWGLSIITMGDELFSKGLIEKGLKGELYSRLMMVLARDFLLADTPDDDFKWSQPYSLPAFISCLLNDAWHMVVLDTKREVQKPTRGTEIRPVCLTLREAFSQALLNFNHFTSTQRALSPDSIRDLLHRLMRQQAALQLSFRQQYWDLLIPMYCGSPETSFDPDLVSAIVVQVKNTRNANHCVMGTEYQAYFSPTATTPVLFILLDLGTAYSSVRVHRHPNRPHEFGIHICGADASVFGFLKKNPIIESACINLFRHHIPVETLAQDICDRNVPFSGHGWGGMLSGIQGNLPGQENESQDTVMNDVQVDEE